MVPKRSSSLVPLFFHWTYLTCFLSLSAAGCNNSAADFWDQSGSRSSNVGGQCSNLYDGIWVLDKSYPLYNSSTCPFVRKEFDCLKFGRLDHQYLQHRWQPSGGCILPRFNGMEFLRRMRGKKIMLVGDSISMNQYNSLLCLIHASIPPNSKITTLTQPFPTVTFDDYGVSIMLHTTHFLVDIIQEKIGAVLNLNSITIGGNIWKQMDLLVFNTWLWWHRTGPKQGWEYIQDGKTISKDMNRMTAFSIAMKTWARWVDLSVDTTKTTVFFQGVSPAHYHGADWGEAGVGDCSRETTPIAGPTRAVMSLALKVQEDAVATIKKPVHFLNITAMSNMRKDGHPSSHNGFHGMDCTHWCVAGVPDTWNQFIYSVLVP